MAWKIVEFGSMCRSSAHTDYEKSDDYEFARDVFGDVDELIRKRKEKQYGIGKRSPKRKMRELEGYRKMTRVSQLSQLSDDSSEEEMFLVEQAACASTQKSKDGSRQGNVGRITSVPSPGRVPLFRDAECQTVSNCSETSDMAQKMDVMLKMMEDMQRKVTRMCSMDLERNVSRLCSTVMGIEIAQKEILGKLMGGLTEVTAERPMTAAISLPFALPLGDYSGFCEAMEMVQQPEIMEQLYKDISRVGGKDETALINRILSKLLTNNFAMNCSWKGQRGGKFSLGSSPILKIVHGGAIRNVGFSHITEDTVKDKIQNWLKQASRRKVNMFPEDNLVFMEGVIFDDEINDD